MSGERDICTLQPATERDTNAPVQNLATSTPARAITKSACDALRNQTNLSSGVDIREAKWQPSYHIKKEEEEFLCIKKEDQEKFTPVWHPHIEDPPQLCPIRKQEEKLLYIKEEQEDVNSLTNVPLKSENEGPIKLSGAEPPSSISILTEDDKDQRGETPADIREAYCPKWQQSYHIKKEEEEFLCIKKEDQEKFTPVWHPHVEDPLQLCPVRKQQEELQYIKEEQEDVTSLTNVPLKSENEGPMKLSGAEESPSSILTEDDNDQRGHTGQKRFCCSVCGQRFSRKGHLNQHASIHAGEKREMPFSCSICDQRFSQKGNLNRHARIHTGEKRERPFSCSICGQRFFEKGPLKYHTRTHTGEKPYSCSFCGKKFARNSHLKSHIRIHTGEKPFSCTICGQSFAEKVTLKRHMGTHGGEKPYSCSICGRKFLEGRQLDRHARTHTGEKPFSCSVCGQRFPWRFAATKHKCVGAKSRDR
ncbi:zinc finger protein 771-like [Corythoichthys intestinalis]|uniref:zinc finger protein 771-like n=1 Tax=Corythoichthys intestinalis TaxID=161448 RepID=UPI0025A5032D|nr:zinc finger protein 771-like [Corythoichthys intestinalis]